MSKNPYLILGLDENCTFAELDDAYRKLSMKYKSERFLEGEEGSNAAKKLEELDAAYNECKRLKQEKANIEGSESIYDVISQLIKDKKLNDAQDKLDNIEYRDAEWHFYQSIIFYNKNWFEDSKKQLEISVSLDPDNPKYANALKNLTETMAKSNPYTSTQGGPAEGQAQSTLGDQSRAGYNPPPPPNANAQACCDTCCALACLDSCCECFGGDCISCC